jgi:ankyrin repeat protein
MISQLKCLRKSKSRIEAKGDIFCKEYMWTKSQIERLEREIGDWTEIIDHSDDKKCVVLPGNIYAAAKYNNIQKVLDWLGPLPVDKQRLNAKNPDQMDFTLLLGAVWNNNSDLISILLQLGADVDAVATIGGTPLSIVAPRPDHNAQARLLLEWGAEISNCATMSKDDFIELILSYGNTKLASLLKSEFGGRRCEIINLPKHPDLIGKTCVVENYLPNKGRYRVIFEISKEVGLVGPENLKRRDRTPDDCGYYITHKNGRTTRQEFASKEECQAFVASLTDGGRLGDGDNDAEAEARAEQAAESLLAELDIESSAKTSDNTKSKKDKKMRNKKGRK